MKPGTIVAIKIDNEMSTGKVIDANAFELTIRLYSKNQIMVLRNWVQSRVQGRIMQRQPGSEILASPKTIVFTQMVSTAPSKVTRLIGFICGYRYQQHHRAMRMQQDECGDPRMVRRWCRRKKLTGVLYNDGFFIAYSGFPVYIDCFNQLKEVIWKK